MEGEVKDLYDSIRQDLIRIHANWQIYTKLYAISDESFVTMNNTAPGFFRLIQDVLVDNAVISLSRLTDPASYNSIIRLVKLLKQQVNHVFYSELQSDLREIESACKEIREHRHKRVAHRVRKDQPPDLREQPQKLPPLTRKKINDVMKSLDDLMNKMLGYFERVEQIFDPVYDGGADELLFFLEKGYEATSSAGSSKE